VQRVTELAEVRAGGRPGFVAVGVFDGVHRGHQHLLETMVAAADRAGARPTLLTFDPHPMAVVQGRTGRLYLCPLEERIALLAGLGLELIVVQRFDDAVRHTRAGDFVGQMVRHLGLRQLWGGSFGLGYNREGDLPTLQRFGAELGFTVHPFDELVESDGRPVSSSRIRRALAAGDITDVTACLGRPYRVSGEVIHGDGRGKAIGVPTANLRFWDELILPANGVYATYAWVDGERHVAATNVGYRPTVNGHSLNVEAHLLDFHADLYGRMVALDFVGRIRDEQKFAGLDALVAQIRADIQQVRRLLEPAY
jgi:riboflavin kinase/FMN adenylyltransferase